MTQKAEKYSQKSIFLACCLKLQPVQAAQPQSMRIDAGSNWRNVPRFSYDFAGTAREKSGEASESESESESESSTKAS